MRSLGAVEGKIVCRLLQGAQDAPAVALVVWIATQLELGLVELQADVLVGAYGCTAQPDAVCPVLLGDLVPLPGRLVPQVFCLFTVCVSAFSLK